MSELMSEHQKILFDKESELWYTIFGYLDIQGVELCDIWLRFSKHYQMRQGYAC